MKVTFERLGKWLPVPVVVMDRMPGRLIGLSLGVFVVVRSDFATDRPTIVHELEHCRQFWKGGMVLHMVRYYISRDYRLKAELDAFRAEIEACSPLHRPLRLEESARVLATCYELDLDVDFFRRVLSDPLFGPRGIAVHAHAQSDETASIHLSPVAARSESRPS